MRTLLVLLSTCSSSLVYADCLTDATNFAERICGELQTRGNGSLLEANGALKADVSGIVKKVVGEGSASISGKSLAEAYENVLRGDLARDLSDNRSCRREMAKVALAQACKGENVVPSKVPTTDAAPQQPSQHKPATRDIVLIAAFSGFSCQTASYGNDWAKESRERIENDLYKVYGCTEPPESSSKPGFSGNFHTPANSDGPWSGFAAHSTILYYDAANKLSADAVAKDLSTRYGHKFVTARGAGQGIPREWFKRTIEVHLREVGV